MQGTVAPKCSAPQHDRMALAIAIVACQRASCREELHSICTLSRRNRGTPYPIT